MNIRKKNVIKFMDAFGIDHSFQKYIDPIGVIPNVIDHVHHNKRDPLQHEFVVQSQLVSVPMEMFWREIDDWEIDSIVMTWKLSLGDPDRVKANYGENYMGFDVPLKNSSHSSK